MRVAVDVVVAGREIEAVDAAGDAAHQGDVCQRKLRFANQRQRDIGLRADADQVDFAGIFFRAADDEIDG